MYKISIWLKGGGKIVEECDINDNEARKIYEELNNNMGFRTNCMVKVLRDSLDEFPIIVDPSEVAGLQIDKNKKKEYIGRKLEARN